jgi:hypothetical protein
MPGLPSIARYSGSPELRRRQQVAERVQLAPAQITVARLLAFERQHEGESPRSRAVAARRELGLTVMRYVNALGRLLDNDENELLDPELIGRLRARREQMRQRQVGRLKP